MNEDRLTSLIQEAQSAEYDRLVEIAADLFRLGRAKEVDEAMRAQLSPRRVRELRELFLDIATSE